MGVNFGGFIDGIANLDGTIFDELKDKVTDVVDDVINSPEALNAISMVGVASMIPMIFENIENVRRDLEE